MAPIELNSEESRCKPFEIDLNETPVCSPRETVSSAERIPAGGSGGGGRVGLLDINALPPSDEETSEFENSGVHGVRDSINYSSNNAQEKCSNVLYELNQFNVPKVPGSMTGFVLSGFEDIVQRKMDFSRNLKETDTSSVVRERTHRLSYQNHHLGLVSNYHSPEPQNRSDVFALMQKGFHLNQIRKESLIFSQVSKECPESLNSSFGGEFSIGATPANSEAIGGCDPLQVGLPVQFEDFCVLAVGEVDPRPPYHSTSQIWPVGYRCSWHDKITGSLFACEVTDGGDFGPKFKVQRSPCSARPIPIGSTVLLRPSFNSHNGECQVDTDDTVRLDDDEYTNIHMLISDDSPPHLECNILSDLGNDFDEAHASETKNGLQTKSNCPSGRPTTSYIELEDDIGEFVVEGRSSSSVWRKASEKLVHACRKVYEQTGACKLCCKHDLLRMWSSSCIVSVNDDATENSDSLDKFCCLSGPIDIPHLIGNNDELDTSCKALVKWLDQDRFGLDVGFVQEIIEQHPRVYICAEYIFLNKRINKSISQTAGSGFLRVTRKGHLHEREADCSPLRGCKRPREQVVENPVTKSCFPPGKPLSSKLPTELMGDVFQSWELLWRFSEVMGLEEPLSFKELEEELIYGHSSTHRRSSSTVPQENEHACVAMETESLREAAHVKQASNTNSGCSGVALVNVLCSLLKILLGELQSKVANFVDSNFDGGETKSRRRRKKDVDNSMSAKKVMLDLLPINGLTWPELARRYVLTVSSMEGNLDIVDFVNHENGKAFHCLRGDGRTIRGSLPGVAGMEADALLLAEATKKVFRSLNRENDMLIIEDEGSDVSGSSGKNIVSDGTIPEWAMLLEPVRKLPTNVGTRIRRCVNDALEKSPPDWAKRILEHSISKEVYKGNASGPTKKAVLSVLANLHNEGLPEKSDKGIKRKTVICISDIIMKQCRIVLRHAAAADDEKVFCNLLGRKLMSSTDNDDEGLLGSPAMVSRPLDFRTIDLRLAVGAYDGSHEAFLEDVQELWNNVLMAFGDQPDFVDLAEKLSENFESLYEKEVITLVQKLAGYAKSECLSSEMKKEIIEIVADTSEIPKAPWDEGVCKICGVDKDDDSVLLCDTCDAEYHTYCLDPPLARIPEGNWYCPSCVVSNHIVQDVSEHFLIIGRHKGKKFQGEFTGVYLEALRHLTAIIEEKEYWEFSVDERTFLLKFLCDELLNSALIRQHLDQCAEATAELQQKLRSLSVEWRNLKSREENLATRVAKVETGMLNAGGELGVKEGPATASTDDGKCVGQLQNTSGRSNYSVAFSDDIPSSEGDREESGLDDFNKQQSDSYSEKNHNYNSQFMKPMGTEGHMKEDHDAISNTKMPSHDNDLSVSPNDLPLSNSVSQENDNLSGEIHLQDKLQDLARDTTAQSPPLNHQGLSVPKETLNSHGTQDVPHVATNELQSYNLELNTIKNDMLLLQDSVTSLESQLSKLSVRREFLGSDSSCRLYWASATPDMHARVIVDGSLTLQQGRKMPDFRDSVNRGSALQNSISSGTAACLNSEGSKVCCPFLNDPNVAMGVGSQWMFYQTDAEIEKLMYWLKDNDKKERELKESILHWKKLRFQDSQQSKTQGQSDYQSAFSTSTNSEKAASFDCLVTKATTLLEKKYGPCFESETTEILKKRGKKARVINEEKMYRCECLELIWPSRNHCLSCHTTFSSDVELEEHNNRCNVTPSVCEKSKGVADTLKRKGNMKSDVHREAVKMDAIETYKSGCSEMTSRLIKFQTEGLMCPYDLEEISSKFMTKDSNKELVQEIGLIGSNGIPSLIPSASPFLGDSTLTLISPQNEVGSPGDGFKTAQSLSTSQGNQCVINAGNYSVADGSTKSAANGLHEVLNRDKPVLGCSEQRDKKPSVNSHFPKVGVSYHCVVPQSSLRPLSGKMSQIARRLKINLLDMDAALPEEALRPSKAHIERRWAWRGFVKSAKTIYEIVQAAIILEGMIKTDYLRNDWWYWSSLSAAAKTCTLSSLALRIYSLDAAIVYGKSPSNLDPVDSLKLSSISEHKPLPSLEMAEKFKVSRRSNKKRKEPEG